MSDSTTRDVWVITSYDYSQDTTILGIFGTEAAAQEAYHRFLDEEDQVYWISVRRWEVQGG